MVSCLRQLLVVLPPKVPRYLHVLLGPSLSDESEWRARKVQFTTSTERVKRGKVFADDDCWYRRLHAYPMSECGTSRIGCYQAGYSDRR